MNSRTAMRLRKAIVQASVSLPDDVATDVPELFEPWKTNTDYVIGDRRKYNGTLWKCVQTHHSQDDWTPDVAVSLWARTDDPSEEWPEWKAPTGAHDAYLIGAKVSHNGKHWINTYDHNIYEPGVYGWDEA